MTKFGLGYISGKNKAPSMMDIINSVGSASGIVFCLDSGVISSWPGSGTQIFDLSGNGRDWTERVSGALASAFSGTPDGATESEYTTFLRIKPETGDAPTTYAMGFTTPGSEFTIASLIRPIGGAGLGDYIFGTWNSDAFLNPYKGMMFYRESESGGLMDNRNNNATRRGLSVTGYDNDSGHSAGRFNSTLTVPNDAWAFAAVSVSSTLSRAIFRVNGGVETVSASWGGGDSSPSVQSPFHSCLLTNGRGGPICVWNRALSSTELSDLYTKIKQYRYPSLT